MQHPEHLISNTRKGLTPERLAGLAFAGLIPAIFIWALIAGLIPPNWTIPYTPLRYVYVPPVSPPPGHPPANPTFHGPTFHMPVPPQWTTTDTDDYTGIHGQYGNGPGTTFTNDTVARGVMSTHTTPPYPSIEARLGHAGTVTLRLSVAADGSVVDATVENSSGSSALDQAAIEWVKSHWRYTPATHNGVAVATTTEAAVRFDLKNAMR